MRDSVYLPIDEVTGKSMDFDRAADVLELSAYFANDSTVLTNDLASQAEIGAATDHAHLDEEIRDGGEQLAEGTVSRIEERQRILGPAAYPFEFDADGDVLACKLDRESVGHAAYILSLLLSNLRAVSPTLGSSKLHPDDGEVRQLREFFQYFATAALASEIQGSAWSFGFPRPDGTGFLEKLTEIWEVLADGVVEPQPGAPEQPKDDRVDVFAGRPHPDGLPGFPLAAAQVATGAGARDKSLKGHLGAFKSRWFGRPPVTEFLIYMVVPFAKDGNQFIDDVRVMGNVLHRLRVPRRAAEASRLVEAGETIEGYDRLAVAAQWLACYPGRARERA